MIGALVATLAACGTTRTLAGPAAEAGPRRGKPVKFHPRNLLDVVRTISLDDPDGAIVLHHGDAHHGGDSFLATNREELSFMADRWTLPTMPTVDFATHFVVGITYGSNPCRKQVRGLALSASSTLEVKYHANAPGPDGEDIMCVDLYMMHSLVIAIPIDFLPRSFTVTTIEMAEDLASETRPWRGYAFELPASN